ncbi:MAG: regulatory protein RecX [Christensenellales bacterium]
MGIITAITDIKGKKNRRGLEIDGQPAGSLHRVTVAEYGLRVGMELSIGELGEIRLGVELRLAKDAGLYYLGRKARSRRELERYLTGKGYDPVTAAAACDAIGEYGYLDDAALSRDIVRGAAARGLGRRGAAEKLRLRGVSRENAEAGLSEYLPEEEADACARTAESLWRRNRREEPGKRREKTAQALFRRGFTWDNIEPVIRRLEEETEEE